MAQNQLSTTNLNQIQAIGEYGLNELQTLKETLGKDMTIPQFNLFMYQCNTMQLNPFLKHAFPILYGGKLDIRVSYEGLLSLAKKSEGYMGVHNQVVCDNEVENFEAESDDDGVITKVKHKIKFPRGKVVGAYSIAKREGKRDVIVLMDLTEVARYLKGQNQKFWKMEDGSPDPDMFKKHVGFRAIKAQYDIASVVEENIDEMNGGAIDNIADYRQDVTPPQTQGATIHELPKREQRNVQEAQTKPVNEPQAVDPAKEKAAKNMLVKNFELLGIEKKDRAAYIQSKLELGENEAPTFEQIEQLNAMMEEQIQNNLLLPEELE